VHISRREKRKNAGKTQSMPTKPRLMEEGKDRK
jgi:hypothetical protein